MRKNTPILSSSPPQPKRPSKTISTTKRTGTTPPLPSPAPCKRLSRRRPFLRQPASATMRRPSSRRQSLPLPSRRNRFRQNKAPLNTSRLTRLPQVSLPRALRRFRRRERPRLQRNAWKRRKGLALKSSNSRRSSTAMPSPRGSEQFLKEDDTQIIVVQMLRKTRRRARILSKESSARDAFFS